MREAILYTMKTDDLFHVEKSLSPRATWARDSNARLHHNATCDPPWCAWLPSNDYVPGIPNDPAECGFGATEREAIDALALLHGALTWHVE